MTNQRIADMITQKLLSNGLVHPGDPVAGRPPMPIVLPVFGRAGMSKEMADLSNAMAKLLGEAIVHAIETDGASVIVDRQEAIDLQAVADTSPGSKVVPVHCRCDRNRTDPLMHITVDGKPRIMVDGKQLIGSLSKRNPDCPHMEQG